MLEVFKSKVEGTAEEGRMEEALGAEEAMEGELVMVEVVVHMALVEMLEAMVAVALEEVSKNFECIFSTVLMAVLH